MSVVDVFQIIGAVANVAMAAAAGVALKQWRKQIAGASHHELGKKVSAALRQVAIAREMTLKNLNWVGELEGDAEASASLKAYSKQELEHSADRLDAAVTAIGSLEGQVAVQWGDEVLGFLDVIRQESAMLATIAHVELRPDVKHAPAVKVLRDAPSHFPLGIGSGTWKLGIEKYTALAQEWLAVHVGREGAKTMSTADLVSGRKQLDEEIKVLARMERGLRPEIEAALQKQLVESVAAGAEPSSGPAK